MDWMGLRVQEGLYSGSPASQRGLNILLRKLQPRVCHGWQHKSLDAFGNSSLYFHSRVPLFLESTSFMKYLSETSLSYQPGERQACGALAITTPCCCFLLSPSLHLWHDCLLILAFIVYKMEPMAEVLPSRRRVLQG